MSRLALALIVALVSLAPDGARADGFDGKSPLACSFSAASQCDTDADCTKVAREDLDLPESISVDFAAKLLRSTDGQRTSPIRSVDVEPTVLIAQGSQNGRGWSMVILRADGSLSGTIAESEGAFVIRGSCSPAP